MSELPKGSSGDSAATVLITPSDIVHRLVTGRGDIRAEVIEVIRRDQFEFKFQAPRRIERAEELLRQPDRR